MPTAPWNEFGYSLEFDAEGKREGLSIDFRSVAELLVELERQAQHHRLDIERIIVAPEYVDSILTVKEAPDIARLASRFMRRPAWVRHDEHLHVDLKVVPPAALP
jgi:penicillin-insensitive murein endopeptidase